MKIQVQSTTLTLTSILELNAANSPAVRDEVKAAMREGLKSIDVDLSETRLIDSSGLGALISLQKLAVSRGGSLRILKPTSTVQQILELTRLHRVFEIVRS